uniref:Uncharacterized protein n=1 Tax=Lepeophtheirus salmonis TaxID=72036 RepID=A0A0K2VLS9_LEPSM
MLLPIKSCAILVHVATHQVLCNISSMGTELRRAQIRIPPCWTSLLSL